jgi:hypothetical protein
VVATEITGRAIYSSPQIDFMRLGFLTESFPEQGG